MLWVGKHTESMTPYHTQRTDSPQQCDTNMFTNVLKIRLACKSFTKMERPGLGQQTSTVHKAQ